MKKFFLAIMSVACMLTAQSQNKTASLLFDSSRGVKSSLTMPDGKIINYTAYTKLYFVTNVEDSTYQYMNIFVPDNATHQTPIFLRTYVGGYMAKSGRLSAGRRCRWQSFGRGLCTRYSW